MTRSTRAVLTLSIAAWAWMLYRGVAAPRHACCLPTAGAGETFAGWMLMVVAMMFPTLPSGMRDVAARSYRSRRGRSVVEYVLGYASVWALAGAAFVALRAAAPSRDPRWAAAWFAFAFAWSFLPARARWHIASHRQRPLVPVGLAADRDALRQGGAHGAPCVLMCAPFMFGCASSGHDLIVMAACTALAFVERRMFELVGGPARLTAAAMIVRTVLA